MGRSPGHGACLGLRTACRSSSVVRRRVGQSVGGNALPSAIIDHQVETIRENWDEVCDEAGLAKGERDMMLGGQFLNPFAFETSRS